MKRAAIYTRISFDPTGQSFSPERQLAECEMMCAARGWEVVARYEDRDRSAFKAGRNERPGLLDLRAAVESGSVDVVVAYSISRLARNTLDFHRLVEWLTERDVTIACVADPVDTTTATGRLITTVIAALAQMESELISERVTSSHRVRRQHGRFPHGRYRHFGYTRDGEIVEDEAKLLREAAERILSGERSAPVARWLNEHSQTTGGNEWTYQSVNATLTSQVLAGRYRDGTPGGWEPILDHETWALLKATINGRRRKQESVKSMLSGLVTCGRCGSRMHAARGGPAKAPVLVYSCRKKAGRPACGGVGITRHRLHDVVERIVLEQAHLFTAHATQVRDLEEDLAGEEQALVELAHARFVERSIGVQEWEAARASLQERIAQLTRQLDAARALDTGPLDVHAWYGGASEAERVRWIRTAIREVVVLPVGRGGRTFKEDRVQVHWSMAFLSRAAAGAAGSPAG